MSEQEDVARAAALKEYSHAKVRDRYDADLLIAGFQDGAAWQRDCPVTEAQIESVAKAIHDAERAWPEWDEEEPELQESWREEARAALEAAKGAE